MGLRGFWGQQRMSCKFNNINYRPFITSIQSSIYTARRIIFKLIPSTWMHTIYPFWKWCPKSLRSPSRHTGYLKHELIFTRNPTFSRFPHCQPHRYSPFLSIAGQILPTPVPSCSFWPIPVFFGVCSLQVALVTEMDRIATAGFLTKITGSILKTTLYASRNLCIKTPKTT